MCKKPIVAGIGELLWDVLPSGKQLGGAPCNFAFHAMQAGCEGKASEISDFVCTQKGATTKLMQNVF